MHAGTNAGPVCESAGGIPGLESSDGTVCCVGDCTQCGGDGCSADGRASECCTSPIRESGETCAETGEAPCLIEDGKDVCVRCTENDCASPNLMGTFGWSLVGRQCWLGDCSVNKFHRFGNRVGVSRA